MDPQEMSSSDSLHKDAHAADTKTKQILAIEVTKEDAGYGKMFGRLVKNSAKVADVKRVIGDGAYDSNSNFLRLAGWILMRSLGCVRILL
jgi:hypothetical protein